MGTDQSQKFQTKLILTIRTCNSIRRANFCQYM